MILYFLKTLLNKIKKLRRIKVQNINIDRIINENSEQKRRNSSLSITPSQLSYESLIEEDASIVDFNNKEATNFYELYKILSQENYELGKSIGEFIEKFKQENKDYIQSANFIPLQMEKVSKFIDNCVSTIFCYFNYGKTITEKMLPYVRPAVENFIFKKIAENLLEIYFVKYEEENKKFLDTQNKIKLQMTPWEVMDYLEIKNKFRGKEIFEGLPFKTTINCINKIQFELTPKDKFECLMKTNLELRNTVLDVTHGKV